MTNSNLAATYSSGQAKTTNNLDGYAATQPSPRSAGITLGRTEVPYRQAGGSTLPSRSAFIGTAPNLAEASNANVTVGRGSMLPKVEPVFERLPVFQPSADVRNSQRGQSAAQTEQQMSSSSTAQKPSQKPKQQARCQKCAIADNLRRVRCCGVH